MMVSDNPFVVAFTITFHQVIYIKLEKIASDKVAYSSGGFFYKHILLFSCDKREFRSQFMISGSFTADIIVPKRQLL